MSTGRRTFSLVSTALAAALLAGCGTPGAGRYAAPELRLAPQWRETSAGVVQAPGAGRPQAAVSADNPPDVRALPAASVAVDWWTAFGDPALDALVAQAQRYNNDLAATAIRVRRAQLNAGLAAVPLVPQLSGNVGASASRGLGSSNRGNGSVRSASSSLGASYEVDLWNRLGSARDAARWEALATVQDRESAAQALAGTTATLYWQVAYANQRLALAAQSIAYAERTVALVQAQYAAGAISGLELAEARQTLASQRASQTQLRQQRVQALNSLGLLFDGRLTVGGAPVGDVAPVPGLPALAAPVGTEAVLDWREPTVLPAGPLPVVEAGLPADLIARRPDVRAAELRLRSSLKNVDATRAAFYPALTLTGALGTSSNALLSLLQNPVASLGAGISLPFLQATQRSLSIQVSQTQYEEAVTFFRQSVYQSLADVDNALSARQQFEAQAALLAESLAEAQRAERLYEIRYRAGSVALKPWLDAQEKRRNAEIAVADNRLNRLGNHATLYQSLGGPTAGTALQLQ